MSRNRTSNAYREPNPLNVAIPTGPPPPSYEIATSPAAPRSPEDFRIRGNRISARVVNPDPLSRNSSVNPRVSPPTSPISPQPQRPDPRSRHGRQQSVEDPLASLARYDVVFLVDDSPSMDVLWPDVQGALMGVAERCLQYDRDGLDVYFMNSGEQLESARDPQSIENLFHSVQPFGSTPTGMRLDDLLRPYVDALEDAKRDGKPRPKPLLLLVITDGRADDPDLVKEVIVEMAGRLDDGRFPPFQLGVQFLQIGDDPDAEEFLRELDDDLKAEHGIRDIVDTVSYPGRVTSEFLLQALLGAVNKKIDAQNTEEHTEKKRRRSTMDERM